MLLLKLAGGFIGRHWMMFAGVTLLIGLLAYADRQGFNRAKAKIQEQIKAGVFPVRLSANDWTSGSIHWLFDVIAPNQKLTTSVIANFKQVVKEGDLRIHPLITRLVDPKTLEKMGAAPVSK